MASRLSLGSLAMTEMNFLPEHRFGSFTYSQWAISINIKTYQYRGKINKKIKKISIQFTKCILLATWLHIVGRCYFLFHRIVAIYISVRNVFKVFNVSRRLCKVQKVNRMISNGRTNSNSKWLGKFNLQGNKNSDEIVHFPRK